MSPPKIYLLLLLTLGYQLSNAQKMETPAEDMAVLSKLNARFISNFVTQDAASHDQIIHKDFVCIEGNGAIVDRQKYLTEWATGYQDSGYDTFGYTDEFIRIFGSTALIRSKTNYTKKKNGSTVRGSTIYTDTYVKENGRWLCVQAQITPIK
jgi:hypothetical protein